MCLRYPEACVYVATYYVLRLPWSATNPSVVSKLPSEVAVSRVGIMITPNQPKYRRLLVDVMNDANLSQGESERSERSQIEDVTNYCENVAQESKW